MNKANNDLDKDDVTWNEDNVQKIKSLLNSKGKGFCLAKWTQVTMHLESGLVHSCHHPKVHLVPLKELEKSPAALFNSSQLKKARKEMLNNLKPSECIYCWRIEDNNGNSDRYSKSMQPWALPHHDTIVEYTGEEDIKPTYLEVSFSNVCNMQCLYCLPEFSSKWQEEIENKGPLKILETDISHEKPPKIIPNREYNPYIEAFWKWWPEIYLNLDTFRITGGEPLLSKHTFKAIDWLIENPNKEMNFAINTNLSIPETNWNNLVKRISKLKECVKTITLYTSVESGRSQSNYVRRGIEYKLLKKRVTRLLKLGIKVTIMSTYNLLAISSFYELLQWVKSVKTKFGNDSLNIDIPYLKSPVYLDSQICTDDMITNYMIPCLDYMVNNDFNPYEINSMKRIINHRTNFNEDVTRHRAMFYDFVNSADERFGTKFLKAFPELKDFYLICKEAREKIINV